MNREGKGGGEWGCKKGRRRARDRVNMRVACVSQHSALLFVMHVPSVCATRFGWAGGEGKHWMEWEEGRESCRERFIHDSDQTVRGGGASLQPHRPILSPRHHAPAARGSGRARIARCMGVARACTSNGRIMENTLSLSPSSSTHNEQASAEVAISAVLSWAARTDAFEVHLDVARGGLAGGHLDGDDVERVVEHGVRNRHLCIRSGGSGKLVRCTRRCNQW